MWLLHITGRRCICIFLDPVLACNLSCLMCYFSDTEKRRSMKGLLPIDDVKIILDGLLSHSLKLQIGCGAEPTLYPNLDEIISYAAGKVPYISLTSNAQLLAAHPGTLTRLVKMGLNELTLSMHGTQPELYEKLMPGAKYEKLQGIAAELAAIKKQFPSFTLRVNYTVNSANVYDLKDGHFWDIWNKAGVMPDVVQLRPVQDLGVSQWRDFNLQPLIDHYDSTIGTITADCRRMGITCLAPSPENIRRIDTQSSSAAAAIEQFSYCYVSPDSVYGGDYNPHTDTYNSYHRRNHTAVKLFRAIFRPGSKGFKNLTKKNNYTIK